MLVQAAKAFSKTSAFLIRRRGAAAFSSTTAGYSLPSRIEIEDVTEQDDTVSITWSDGHKADFHFSWLCDNNPLRFTSCGQKMPISSILPQSPSIRPTSFEVPNSKDAIYIRWGNQDSDSIFSSSFLRSHCYSDENLDELGAALSSSVVTSDGKPPSLEYSVLMKNKEGIYKWLKSMNDHGLCLIKNVPCDDGEVLKISSIIGKPSHGIYGDKFDVKTVPNPINIAFSDAALEYHMDLAYYESPPGLQFLHALKFDEEIEGGESTFIDAHAVAEEFKSRHPQEFETLVRVPATFQKNHVDREFPVRLFYKRPHISVNYDNEVNAVFWSPPFEGPLTVRPEDVDAYYTAYAKFRELMLSPEMSNKYGLRFRLQQGDLICFNNRRMLHGREAFKSHNGERHLQGCYNTIDDFLNTYRVYAFDFDPKPEDFCGDGIAAYGEQRVGTTSHR